MTPESALSAASTTALVSWVLLAGRSETLAGCVRRVRSSAARRNPDDTPPFAGTRDQSLRPARAASAPRESTGEPGAPATRTVRGGVGATRK